MSTGNWLTAALAEINRRLFPGPARLRRMRLKRARDVQEWIDSEERDRALTRRPASPPRADSAAGDADE